MLIENFVNIVIQINGKKRGIVQTKPEIEEEDVGLDTSEIGVIAYPEFK